MAMQVSYDKGNTTHLTDPNSWGDDKLTVCGIDVDELTDQFYTWDLDDIDCTTCGRSALDIALELSAPE